MKSDHPRLLSALSIAAFLLLCLALWAVFRYAPLELSMGAVQKVFYFHVSANWAGMLGFVVALVVSVIYLRTAELKWDVVAVASIELGMVFTAMGIVSGMIWARPTWNTWWTWDPRLTTIAVVEIVYAAYFMLRQGIEEGERRARLGAVYSIIGFVSVPLTFFSIRFARTIHPVVIGNGDPSNPVFNMTPAMLQTFLLCLIAFSVLFVVLLWHRLRLGILAQEVEDAANVCWE